MGRLLIIGCGGVAGVAIHKCCQNSKTFSEICIASRTKEKCDTLKKKLEATTDTKITTAQVNADKVEELVALIRSYQPDAVLNVALPYQDLTIMEACLECKVDYIDTANYEPEDTDDQEWRAIYEKRCKEAGFTAYFDYSWQWAYRERFKEAGITALLGSGFYPESVQIDQVSCWLTYTNEKTHEIIRENLDRSPLYSGMIEGTGPRYCPSIEDKVVRFADKSRHQVFIEPEGLNTNEMYVGGMSSSLPEDVQYDMYRSVPGLEHAKIVRNAYAIEYDCINPRQLMPTLEFKNIKNLFSGGQFNGSSGYEEAAAQGLIAGINAALKVKGEELLVLDRSEAYIGVLIDDLVTKENHEPYRMMTSRAEYRLLLRQDNADLRLREKGYRVGLISKEQYQDILKKEQLIKEEIERVEHVNVGASRPVQELLEQYGSTPLTSGSTLGELIRRPELNYEVLAPIDKNRPELRYDIREQVNINIKYDGYITRQLKQVEQFKKLESKKIPEDMDYDQVKSLRIEAVQKLKLYRPVSIGQASRIAGVSPADVSVLLVYLESHRA